MNRILVCRTTKSVCESIFNQFIGRYTYYCNIIIYRIELCTDLEKGKVNMNAAAKKQWIPFNTYITYINIGKYLFLSNEHIVLLFICSVASIFFKILSASLNYVVCFAVFVVFEILFLIKNNSTFHFQTISDNKLCLFGTVEV